MNRQLILSCVLLALCSCSASKPEGQVLASVNGDEITRPEFNAAIGQLYSGVNAPQTTAQRIVMDRLINQRLVAQSAKADGIDKSPEYILQSRDASDTILVNLFAAKITNSLTTPYEQDIKAYIAANPSRFAQRTLFTLDQIRVAKDQLKDNPIAGIRTLDGIAQHLDGLHISYQRGRAQLDSAPLAQATFKQLNNLPAGDAFTTVQNGMVIASSVIGRQPAPLDGDSAHDLALSLLKQETAEKALTNRLTDLRKTAKIQYQSGFEPAKPKT